MTRSSLNKPSSLAAAIANAVGAGGTNGVTVSENVAGEGGGISSFAALSVSGSTVSNNTSDYGGGIWNTGNLTVESSTVSGNSTGVDGGGIYNQGGTLVVQYITTDVDGPIGPFPLDLGRDRITDETAAVTFLDPKQPVLVAGDPEMLTRRERLEAGVSVPDDLMEQLRGVAERAAVPFVLTETRR